jgi:hypothetical protein
MPYSTGEVVRGGVINLGPRPAGRSFEVEGLRSFTPGLLAVLVPADYLAAAAGHYDENLRAVVEGPEPGLLHRVDERPEVVRVRPVYSSGPRLRPSRPGGIRFRIGHSDRPPAVAPVQDHRTAGAATATRAPVPGRITGHGAGASTRLTDAESGPAGFAAEVGPAARL